MNNENRECPRCGSREVRLLFKEDRFKHTSLRSTDYEYIYTWGYFVCEDCGLVFTEMVTRDE